MAEFKSIFDTHDRRGVDGALVTIEVEMRAFPTCATCGQGYRRELPGTCDEGGSHVWAEGIRPVNVPREEWDAVPAHAWRHRLELVFRYGQNDFQPKPFCSVSVGDVVRLDGKRYLVARMGFEEVK